MTHNFRKNPKRPGNRPLQLRLFAFALINGDELVPNKAGELSPAPQIGYNILHYLDTAWQRIVRGSGSRGAAARQQRAARTRKNIRARASKRRA